MVHFDKGRYQKSDTGVGGIPAPAHWFDAEPRYGAVHGLEYRVLAVEESGRGDEVRNLYQIGLLLAIDFGLDLGCS